MGWASRANPKTRWSEQDWLTYKLYDYALAEDAERALAKTASRSVWTRLRALLRRLLGR